MARETEALLLRDTQKDLFFNPQLAVETQYDLIYIKNQVILGWPLGAQRLFAELARENTVIIIGVALGDEGKGRLVDNKIKFLLEIPGVQKVVVIRFQGGSNAGHTIQIRGENVGLHQVPSGIMYAETVGIMDRGMVIHPEDLITEIGYIEDKVGDTRGKLILSSDAILVTDLERAEEVLNTIKQKKAAGGTGRGIGPAYAHFYDRLGLNIHDLMDENWRETLGTQYDRYEKEFTAFGLDLPNVLVPDFKETKRSGKSKTRTVGQREEFLDRLEDARKKLIEKDLVKNTFVSHTNIYSDLSYGVLFEGAQALGLHAWLGTRPDVTSSDTSMDGIKTGTAVWRGQDILDRIGVFKIPYTSSVGVRKMPTHIELPKDLADLPETATDEQKRAAYIRVKAREKGTTSGRFRDILHLDLEMIRYNCRMAGIEVLAGTHLDIAREGETIKVCTHYTNGSGERVPYQPGLRYLNGVIPHYIELPGWDGEAVAKAKSIEELPDNARYFLAFIQGTTGYPIVAVTTGPARENFISVPDREIK